MEIKKVTIKQGDTLSKIANDYGVDINDIIKWNKDTIKDPNKIYVGNTLNIQKIEEVELKPNNKSENIELKNEPEIIEPIEEEIANNNINNTSMDIQEKEIETSNDEIIDLSNEEIIGNGESNQIDELSDVYGSVLKTADGWGYRHLCGVLTRNQLEAQGIVDIAKTNCVGKGYAKNLYEKQDSVLNDDYYAIGYKCNSSNQKNIFDNLVKEKNGNLSNLIISFSPGGSFPNAAGHVMLISKISDGNVYFMDNFKCDWGVEYDKINVMPIEQFRDNYLKDANNANFMTNIRKRGEV